MSPHQHRHPHSTSTSRPLRMLHRVQILLGMEPAPAQEPTSACITEAPARSKAPPARHRRGGDRASEPPIVRAPWAQLTEEEQKEREREQHARDQQPHQPWISWADHLATRALTTLGRSRAGASSARARAKDRMKEAASSLHRPPTSTASTTNRHLCARTSSG